MKVYDEANNLARSLEESEEYVNFKTAKQYINLNPELKEKIQNFEKERYAEQMNLINTGKKDEKKLAEIQKIYEELIQTEEIKKYFEAELRFNIMLANVNKIITESVKDVLVD